MRAGDENNPACDCGSVLSQAIPSSLFRAHPALVMHSIYSGDPRDCRGDGLQDGTGCPGTNLRLKVDVGRTCRLISYPVEFSAAIARRGGFMIEPLEAGKYRSRFDSRELACASTEELKPSFEIIGQERAQKALDFGLNIEEQGFNVFAAGVPGTGRATSVKKFIEELARKKPGAGDWVYVNNFANPYEPKAIQLPPGMGKRFREDMSLLIQEVRKDLPRVFQSEDYATRRQQALGRIEAEKQALVTRMNEKALEKGFVIQMSPVGLVTIPIHEGRPLSQEEIASLSEMEREELQTRQEQLNSELRQTLRQLREMDLSAIEAVTRINREVALFAIGPLVTAIKEKYAGIAEILTYIDAMQNDIAENLPLFLAEGQPPQATAPFQHPSMLDIPFRKYQVNVIVDNSKQEGAPVVFEQNPTYQNLFGKVEKEIQFGVITTDFTMIRAGSVHRGNGGFLVIPVEELLHNPFAWDGLKNALKTQLVSIEEPGERMGFITAKGLKPEPIPLRTKIVLIGTPFVYQALYAGDPDFQELFKVRADFDTVMERNEENIRRYSEFICMVCARYRLQHLDRSAIAKVIEFGSRLAADQKKLSTRFSDVTDLIREASYYAKSEGSRYTTEAHVRRAIGEKIYRSNLIQEKIQDYIRRGILLIETSGSRVGQVNGLSVIGMGDYAFGRPSKVTASVGLGSGRIIDIEREAKMGGPIHTKGVLILSGFLTERYARDKPLSLAARLVFEQSYEGIEGDSASSTELYAILSALSGLPVKQSIAVTGSVNQKGEVQAIGGVNEKIEGFFEVCRAKGMTGEEGVIIPASNVENLMLKDEVVEAAERGLFRIYPVRNVDEGIEVLTGVPAGRRLPDGGFEEGTVNQLVDLQLRSMAEKAREFHTPPA